MADRHEEKLLVDALPYYDQGYEAPGVQDAVSVSNARLVHIVVSLISLWEVPT